MEKGREFSSMGVGFCKFNSFCVCNICEDVTNREEKNKIANYVSLLFLYAS